LGEIDGIDVLLQQLAFFKRHDPANTEEGEMMENLFNTLCSALMATPNRDRFLKGEGLQLMNLMLREKKLSRNGALKVLDYAMNNVEGTDNCNKFVDILGLRTVFPLFMKTPAKHKRKGLSPDEHEEHICSIISSLLKNCKGTQRQRLLNKFVENDLEKVDRLMELHFKYLEKVQLLDQSIERDKAEMRENGEEVDADFEDQVYIRRLDGGLFTLQLVDYVMLEACASGTPAVKQRVMQILNLRGGSIKTIRNVMREYAGNLGDAKDEEQRELEQQRVLQLVDKF
jgi:beta-catenin-like protein 1